MVLINDKKFACESCIKGHRTSSCNHPDRPLFEIKRKGRPVSQCNKCREMRKTRRVHSKCLCNEIKADDLDAQDSPSGPHSASNFRRFVLIAPAPPSGIKDVPLIEKETSIADSRYQVDRLLNPCRCKSIWECQCNRSPAQGRFETQVSASIAPKPVPPTSQRFSVLPTQPSTRKSCCTSKSAPRVAGGGANTVPVRGPDLPPLLFNPNNEVSPPRDASPFATPTSIPSIKSIVSLAGTGCSCGFECACPGCAEHHVPPSQEGSSGLRSCPDDCPHCVDRLGGIALPEPGPSSQRHSFGTAIEPFLTRVANLPPPPKNRSAVIDPTNITVFPAGLFSLDLGGSSDLFGQQEKARYAWGLVEIPKLECCAGACGCPDGRCACGNSCAGCCVEGDNPSDPSGSSNALAEPTTSCCTNT